MTLHISPYLVPYLKTADQLPDQLPDVPEAVVQALQARIRKLVRFVAVRDERIEKLVAEIDRRADVACDNDVGRPCYQVWPQDPASWCEGCRQAKWHNEPEDDPRVDEIIGVEPPRDEDR